MSKNLESKSIDDIFSVENIKEEASDVCEDLEKSKSRYKSTARIIVNKIKRFVNNKL